VFFFFIFLCTIFFFHVLPSYTALLYYTCIGGDNINTFLTMYDRCVSATFFLFFFFVVPNRVSKMFFYFFIFPLFSRITRSQRHGRYFRTRFTRTPRTSGTASKYTRLRRPREKGFFVPALHYLRIHSAVNWHLGQL
jgi:hypothetical protein